MNKHCAPPSSASSFGACVSLNDGGLVSYSQDVTEQRYSQKALREKERIIERIAELTPMVINVFDLESARDA